MVNKFTKEEIFAILYELRLAPRHQLEDAAEKIVEADANKAAEEGGLPKISNQVLAAAQDEANRQGWSVLEMDFAAILRAAFAADRASRHVASVPDAFANKAEVEVNECAMAIYDISLMLGLPRGATPADVCLAVDRLATPPATTGASTVLTDERIDAIAKDACAAKRIRWSSFTKDDDGKFTIPVLNKEDYDFAREVAAQAGQVAATDDHMTDDQKWLLETAEMAHSGGYPELASKIRAACKATANAGQVAVPGVPTEEMLNASRDWAVKKYGIGIGKEAAIGCWQAMYAAAISAPSPAKESK